MEIIMINESKLKIMLLEEDLKQFEIKADELDYSNTETKRMFWDILNRAKHQIGFDTDGQRVLVQLYPSKGGGCEMFVTKIGLLRTELEETQDNTEVSHRKEKTSLQIKHSKKKSTHKGACKAFCFEKTDNLIDVCKRLISIGYIGESSAYIGDDKKSYLLLSNVELGEYLPLDEFSFIVEYGTLENTESVKYYISEHAKALCEKNAVETLGNL